MNRHTRRLGRTDKHTARIHALVAMYALCLLVTIARFWQVQIIHHHTYAAYAEQQYSALRYELHPRGTITDRYGNPLVHTTSLPSAFILARQLQNRPATEAFLMQHAPACLVRMAHNPQQSFMWIARHLSDDAYHALVQTAPHDVHFTREPARTIPYGSCSALIGASDLDGNGVSGLELFYNEELRGTITIKRIRKDARRGDYYFDEKRIASGVDGSNIGLTIDLELQNLVQELLQAAVTRWQACDGAAVVIDPDSGEIHALASTNPDRALAVTDCFEFGSVNKVFTLLAALAHGSAHADELINCEGKSWQCGTLTVTNPTPVDIIPVRDVIRFSSNVGTAKLALRLGKNFYEHLAALGFGVKTGIDFPGERAGTLMSPKHWSATTLPVLSFGYEVAMTLLQLARAFCVIASDGTLITPHLRVLPEHPSSIRAHERYTPALCEEIKSILEPIARRCHQPGYRIYGKTGTARIAEHGTYSIQKHIYSFVGGIESVKTGMKRVVAVYIREPAGENLWARQVAEPLFGSIARAIAVHEQLANARQCVTVQ